jgi:hypothetical protein
LLPILKNSSIEAADHCYDDVYQVEKKTMKLFRENRKIWSRRPNEIMKATPSASIQKLAK